DLQIDGNLHWNPLPGAKVPVDYFAKLRTHPLSEFNKTRYPAGFGANELAENPRFAAFDAAPDARNEYRLADGSPAIGKGVMLPAEWPDPFRPADGARPDIGALPAGAPSPGVGIRGRIAIAGASLAK